MGVVQKQGKKEVKVLRVDGNVLYRLQMKYQRSKVTEYEALSDAITTQLDSIVERGGKPDEYQLETMTEMLDFVLENIERERELQAAKERSAEEWRQLEYEYASVREGKYSMTTIEALPSYNEAEYRECEYLFCITAFKPARKNAVYCSEQCRKKQHEAKQEFARTSKVYANGTYLPIKAYLSNRDVTEQRKYEEYELFFDEETLQLVANEGSDEYDPTANAANRERRVRAVSIEEQVAKVARKPSEVITYKLSDMTDEEVEKTFPVTKIKHLKPSVFLR